MGYHLEIKEDTDLYSSRLEVDKSNYNTGAIIISLAMKNNISGEPGGAGIRLTRDQARQVADHLNALADQLFFEEQRANANE